MTKRLAVLLCCLALGTAATGCGSDDKGGGGSSGGGTASSTPKGKPDVTVAIQDIKFKPPAVTVKKGQTVQWANRDSVAHNVTKQGGPGPSFKSSNLNQGDKYSYTFATRGKFDYLCTLHPNQTGTVTVK